MASYVIVAIPPKDDYVWKISSEKVPHLTLMYLGENLQNVSRVVDYIAHVVNTNLYEFALDVERRGVLGDQFADVLFMGNYNTKMLKDVRGYFLQNTDIRRAYEAADQYPVWLPHLTLGYPETPAKEDDRDYFGIHSIRFDRIGLWTGDYEGVDFPLKSPMLRDDYAYHTAESRGEATLAHYGIKGMKWGRRKDDAPSGPEAVSVKASPGSRVKTSGGRRHGASDDAIRVASIRQKAKKSTTDSLSNKEFQDLIQRMNMERQYSQLKGAGPVEKGINALTKILQINRLVGETKALGSTVVSEIKRK